MAAVSASRLRLGYLSFGETDICSCRLTCGAGLWPDFKHPSLAPRRSTLLRGQHYFVANTTCRSTLLRGQHYYVANQTRWRLTCGASMSPDLSIDVLRRKFSSIRLPRASLLSVSPPVGVDGPRPPPSFSFTLLMIPSLSGCSSAGGLVGSSVPVLEDIYRYS